MLLLSLRTNDAHCTIYTNDDFATTIISISIQPATTINE